LPLAASIYRLITGESDAPLEILVRRVLGVFLADQKHDWNLADAAMGDALHTDPVPRSIYLQWAL
jgi:hypothetical protein